MNIINPCFRNLPNHLSLSSPVARQLWAPQELHITCTNLLRVNWSSLLTLSLKSSILVPSPEGHHICSTLSLQSIFLQSSAGTSRQDLLTIQTSLQSSSTRMERRLLPEAPFYRTFSADSANNAGGYWFWLAQNITRFRDLTSLTTPPFRHTPSFFARRSDWSDNGDFWWDQQLGEPSGDSWRACTQPTWALWSEENPLWHPCKVSISILLIGSCFFFFWLIEVSNLAPISI